MIRTSLRLLCGGALLSLLGACSILPKGEAPDIYRLPAQAQAASSAAAVTWSLRVSAPQASRALDSTRIAVIPAGDQLSAYKGARWTDTAPAVLRGRLLDAFRNDGRVRALSSDAVNLQADLALDGDLGDFQSEYRDGQVQAVIRLDARLVAVASGRILASQRFEARVPASGKQVAQVVEAFGQAADRLSAEVVAWTLREGQAQRIERP
ncbi:MAG: hypothetical protein GAK45_02075 [Pseudomonas citronellolis]|nr:MAG: hypothetical protein GAK45_02075 [Pseudomonas citronellolis]